MFHHLVTCVVVVSALLAAPISASAAVVANEAAVYDTVDAIEVNGNRITITGIVAGQSAPSELNYGVGSEEVASRCDRLALLAMSKPGKFRFATARASSFSGFACKLMLRTP
jgi:hypothetical protein